MKLKQPKSCGECRASVPRQSRAPYCEFNFKTRVSIGPAPFKMPRAHPIEPCWKPITIKDYIACRERLDAINNPTTEDGTQPATTTML